MPKKNRRQPRRRIRTKCPTRLLDLSDEVLVKILRNLGLEQVLTPLTLRKTTPAFLLALTCRRLYRLFCEHITDIDLLQDQTYPPPLYHPTHSDVHVRWVISNLPNLRLLELAQESAHLLNALPRTARLETLKFEGDYELSCPTRLPRTLRVFHLSRPSLTTMQRLASLQESATSCRLKTVFISALKPAHIDQLRNFYTGSCQEIDYMYTSFALSRDHDQRDEDNEAATRYMRFVSSTHEEYAPRLTTLSFAVTGESRMDLDFDGYDLDGLHSGVIDPFRTESKNRKDLRLLSIWTDAALLESWVKSISSVITPFVAISIETAQTCKFFIPPLMGLGEPATVKYRLTSRNAQQTGERNPHMPSLRSQIFGGTLRYLNITERFVVEKFFFTDAYRSHTLAYLGETDGITNIALYFAFGLRAQRMFVWEDEQSTNVMNNVGILTDDHDETPEEMAYTFLSDILCVCKGVEQLSLSFEAVSYAPENELLVNKILQSLRDVTELELIMPSENCEGHPRDGLVKVTENFLHGLPIFLRLLTDSCPKLEKFHIVDVGEMSWENDSDRQVLLTAEEALDRFERRRPTVFIEYIRAMLHFWKR